MHDYQRSAYYMETLAIKLNKIKLSYQSREILDIDNLAVYHNDVIGIIGQNGSGKSTLLKLIAGKIQADEGQIQRQLDFNYLGQMDEVDEHYRADSLQSDILGRLKVPTSAIESLSGGEKHKFQLAQVLSVYKMGLLLDEPTTHLDKESIDFLIDELRYYYGTLIIVSHDRYFLNQLVHKIWEVEDGKLTEYAGNYDDYLESKNLKEKEQAEAYKQYTKEKKRLEKAVAQKEEQAQKAGKKSQKQRARAIKPDRLSSSKQKDTVQKAIHKSAKAIEKRIDQLESVSSVSLKSELEFPKAKHLEIYNDYPIMGYNTNIIKGSKILLEGANFQFPLGKVIAITGKNGSGKSSLLNYIVNQEKGITLSSKVEFSIYKQLDYQLAYEIALLDYLMKRTEFPEKFVRSLLNKLDFKQNQMMTALKQLSGGEATRVALAELFVKPSNVLILDEPTNFIDIYTIQALESFIKVYPGTVLLTSHDQEFVKSVSDIIYRIEDRKLIQLK